MANGFVKNYELLEETSKVRDLLGCKDLCDRFLKKITSINKSSIVALVGPFGSGKSTMLFRIMNERKDQEEWIEFDAWKYPDRKDLWEGFVLDFARAISPEEFAKTDKILKGKQNDDKQALIKALSNIPGLAVLKSLNHFYATSPATRVDEVQKILQGQINKSKKDVFIIIEDIDRSGDAGLFFLETVKQFMRAVQLNKKITIIVPIADENYHKYLNSYLKCIDYFDFLEHKRILLSDFVGEVFDDGLFAATRLSKHGPGLEMVGEKRKSQTISFLEELFIEHPSITMRLLKIIIRKADMTYKSQTDDGHNPDFRINLCLEAARYFKYNNNSNSTYYDEFKRQGFVSSGNIFSSFLVAMLFDFDQIYEIESTANGKKKTLHSARHGFKFAKRKHGGQEKAPSIPWQYGGFDQEGYAIDSFYLEY